jgi:hypothetical protein
MIWSYGSSHGNCCKSKKFAEWLDLLNRHENCTKQCSLLSLLVLVTDWPLCWCVWTPDGSPLGECAPLLLENCALVIPPSESVEMCLKLIALVFCEMGRKGFPGSAPMIAREPRMFPPQVSHSQCLENAPQMWVKRHRITSAPLLLNLLQTFPLLL